MTAALNELAKSVGVLTQFRDWKGNLQTSAPEAVVQVLRTLGLDISSPDDTAAAAAHYHRMVWTELAPPCTVAWDQAPAAIDLRVPASDGSTYVCELTLESGQTRRIEGSLFDLEVGEHTQLGGQEYVRRTLYVPVGEHGYHSAVIEVGNRRASCTVFGAPLCAYRTPYRKRWGLFAPLYAIHRQGGSGAGDLADLMRLGGLIKQRGGDLIGTLPLLASFLDEPYEYSPYAPVSRMFWNELYLDLATAPGLGQCPAATDMLVSAEFRDRAEALRSAELVDYRGQMALKRGVLTALSDAAWKPSPLRSELEGFAAQNPRVDDYARFRAVTEAQGRVWRDWPERMRGCDLRADDYDPKIRNYHLYVQYAMNAQLSRLGKESGVQLYLDLPVGAHRYGYDTWRDRDAFALDVSTGAPPDELFTGGQNWGGAPLHPWGMRKSGYRYFIDSVRAHFEHSGILRIDHAMGLHRLYWVPEGVSAKEGIYVHYNAGELYAILSIESHRNQCEITGEDLGTVPDYVRPAMERHGLARLYVAQFALPEYDGGPIQPPPKSCVASLNTHDSPTFAGFWLARDIEERFSLGLIDKAGLEAEQRERRHACHRVAHYLHEQGFLDKVHLEATAAADTDTAQPAGTTTATAVMRAFSAYLGASEAEIAILTLEDLWMEDRPQNIPGTGPDLRPNWRRKLVPTLDEIVQDTRVSSALKLVDEKRRARA